MRQRGMILKGVGGLYTVRLETGVYECRARGIFRKRGIVPLAGDIVWISEGMSPGTGEIEAIEPRKNQLIRPPIANLDQLIIVTSLVEPRLNLFIIDKMTAVAEDKGIEPVLILTKTDLADPSTVMEIYRKVGIRCFTSSQSQTDGLDELRAILGGRISAVSGNSGVGKSTLMNRLLPELSLQTADISRKLGRGKHTTRQVELFPLSEGGFLADTPGFSTLDVERYERIQKENLAFCFPEFLENLGHCQFASCTHRNEKGCAVLRAVEEGRIAASRHKNYVTMYNEAEKIKDWE